MFYPLIFILIIQETWVRLDESISASVRSVTTS